MSSFTLPKETSRIAVIGAGPAGLGALRHFLSIGYETHAYEATGHIGGTWVYNPRPSKFSAVYDSLHCNIPKEVMAYTDFPFPPEVPSFPHHTQVLAYLRSFASKHDLERHICFNSPVTHLEKRNGLWELSTSLTTETYHAVLICIGHFSKPNPWDVPGLEHLSHRGIPVIHSQEYRHPAPFKDLNVLVVGAGPSGQDLAREVSSVASKVFLAHNRNRALFVDTCPSNLSEVDRPRCVLADGSVELDNGSILAPDIVLACTGYVHNLPFLRQTATAHVAPHGRAVRGLICQLVARDDPTLAIIGLPVKILPFPLFEDQIGFVAAIYNGRVTDEVLRKFAEQEDQELEMLNGDDRAWHILGDRQWEYRRQLACAAGKNLPEISVKEIYDDAAKARKKDLFLYRDRQYKKLGSGPGMWRVTFNGEDITGTNGGATQ